MVDLMRRHVDRERIGSSRQRADQSIEMRTTAECARRGANLGPSGCAIAALRLAPHREHRLDIEPIVSTSSLRTSRLRVQKREQFV